MEKKITTIIQEGFRRMAKKEDYADTTEEISNAKDKTSQEKVSKFRMGTKEEYQKNDGKTSIKTRLIKEAGGYGHFQAKYGKDPFTISRQEATRLIKRNQKCFCGSEKKYKRCCLSLNG
jgi:uncharacterized protein YchJ